MYVDSSGFAIDAPGSYHISGSYSSEVRRIPLIPGRGFMADNDSDQGKYGPAVSDATSSDPHTASTAGKRYVLGTMMSNASSEAYIYCPPVPSGWKATAIYISLYDKNAAAAAAEDIAVVSRTFSHASGSGTTRHLQYYYSGTNQERNFSSSFVPNGSNYLVCYLGIDSLNQVYLGGYLKIVRV